MLAGLLSVVAVILPSCKKQENKGFVSSSTLYKTNVSTTPILLKLTTFIFSKVLTTTTFILLNHCDIAILYLLCSMLDFCLLI